jgi:LPS export ABC transporter protein LptC
VVLAVAVAALAGACKQNGAEPPVATDLAADSAEQVLYGVHWMVTGNGIARGEMFADTMYTYDDNTRLDLRRVRTTFFNSVGAKDGTLTANRGAYNVRLGSMEGWGDVVVISEAGRKLETQQLRYDPTSNEITSDSAFVFTEPGRRIEGVGFITDPQMNTFRVLSGAKGSGSDLRLPDR